MNVSTGQLPFSSNAYRKNDSFFTELTVFKAVLYSITTLYVTSVAVIALIEPLLTLPCDVPYDNMEFPNPDFVGIKCRRLRHAMLLGMNLEECSFGRRLVSSVLLGGVIGWERRQADRPAGIRTMSLVSLGSCLFTINSIFAFEDGPMTWDSSRVSAAIPSGVGFLGAGLIFKKEQKSGSGDTNHVVHGLTTAASLWVSAAVGIACGGELYFPASFGVAVMMLMLRFAPRGGDDIDDDSQLPSDVSPGNPGHKTYSSTDEIASLVNRRDRKKPKRPKSLASLASVV